VLELKGVLFDLLTQQEQVRILIQKKLNEEQAKVSEVAKTD
jgi:hypothetical protein